MQNESERLRSDQAKLERVNTDLQSAQMIHKQENEKLRVWKEELQGEQQRLDELQLRLSEKSKLLESTTLKLTEQELEL